MEGIFCGFDPRTAPIALQEVKRIFINPPIKYYVRVFTNNLKCILIIHIKGLRWDEGSSKVFVPFMNCHNWRNNNAMRNVRKRLCFVDREGRGRE